MPYSLRHCPPPPNPNIRPRLPGRMRPCLAQPHALSTRPPTHRPAHPQPEEDDTPLYTYYYTRPMYAWAPTTKRIRIAVPDNINKIPAVLTEETGGRWEKDDDSLAGLVKTRDPVALEPEEIVMKLLDLDNGMPFTFEEP